MHFGKRQRTAWGWEQLRVIDSGDTIELLPIMSLDEERDGCAAGEFSYKKQVELPLSASPRGVSCCTCAA